MRSLPVAGVLLALPVVAQAAQQAPAAAGGGYLVLAAVAPADPFHAAARVLADNRRASIVAFDPADLEPVRAVLTKTQPRHVALVMRPEQVELAFQRRFLQLATEVDDDPFVDFAFGYVTGRTADDALDLARRGVAREPKAVDGIATVAGGVDESAVRGGGSWLRRSVFDALQILCAGEKAFPETGRDVAFLRDHLRELEGRDAVTFVGHGYPREIVGGPTFAELAGLDLAGAVVLNVGCYTGVTRRWYEDDWRRGVTRAREVPLEQSFGLAVLHAGALGYTAYLCPRPAGPELETDLAALLTGGSSLGDARRRDYDKTVLGFLGFGEERLQLAPVADGAELASNPDAVRDLMLEGATGGVLFGDPACVPFVARPEDVPVRVEAGTGESGLAVKARVAADRLWLHCSDPTARWGNDMAMRVYARLPLGDALVTDVVVDECRLGKVLQPTRVLWAVESDQGERFLQLKVVFPRAKVPAALRLAARVLTTTDAAAGRARGGEVQRPRVATKNVRSRVIEPFLLERATAREVSREVLQHALDASAGLLGEREVDAAVVETFAARGSEGFRAVVAMLEVGHAHYRSWELLRATWRPGDERHLLALASGPDLPNFASWAVLRGLGVADTPEVRSYLPKRLAEEQDAGLYMSVAAGLAELGARGAIAPIGARVLEFRDGWSGVQDHLVSALLQLGGAEAAAAIEAIASDARCTEPGRALRALDEIDPAAAERVRAARRR